MPQAIFAAAATLGAEAIGFAFATEAATWSWAVAGSKMSFSGNVLLVTERPLEPPDGGL